MTEMVFKDGTVVEVKGEFQEVLHAGMDEAHRRQEYVVLRTDNLRLVLNPWPGDSDSYKVVYGWRRDHRDELCRELERHIEKFEPDVHVWAKERCFKIQYLPGEKSESISDIQARMYLDELKHGLAVRFSQRKKKSRIDNQGSPG